MSKEIFKGELAELDLLDVGIGVGAFLGLFIVGTEFIKITDAQSAGAAQLFITRIITMIGVSLGTAAAIQTSSDLRHGKS